MQLRQLAGDVADVHAALVDVAGDREVPAAVIDLYAAVTTAFQFVAVITSDKVISFAAFAVFAVRPQLHEVAQDFGRHFVAAVIAAAVKVDPCPAVAQHEADTDARCGRLLSLLVCIGR